MKKLSAYLFLILFSFSAPSFADEIIDFEETLRNKMNWVEGITVGITTIEFDNWIRSKK